MKRCSIVLTALLAVMVAGAAEQADPTRVLEAGKLPEDSRLGKPKDLDGYFPMTPPAGKEAWERRRGELREQVLVATGLWPMPEKTPLHPVIHGKIERDDYTIEKVFFASYPGHYVSGNLYRPRGKAGKVPGVLFPHGHWNNGRFYDALADHGEKYVQNEIKQGGEQTVEGARYPLQAGCAQLARMGCVVFHYDAVGYADSQQIKHRTGFTDAQAELHLQSFMGLQTYNSIRALDFLTGLPDVDPPRIGVTGASGGATQTLVLCAIDDRPAAAFPMVMVSTAMQGGCVCENCSYLRQATGNVELAGLLAPKPLGMTGANDWTKEIETKGLPELKALYGLYGAGDLVMARCFPKFEHNMNQVSREVMYNWFNKHLGLGREEPVHEKPFVPVPPAELSVFDGQHPRPGDATGVDELRRTMTKMSDRQLADLSPRDHHIRAALRVMVADRLPGPDEVEARSVARDEQGKVRVEKLLIGRKGQGEQVPALLVTPETSDGTIVVWIHPAGKASLMREGKPVPAARLILDRKAAILAPDVFMTGEFGAGKPAVNEKYAGFTFGYNRPLLANRVHDVLSAVAVAVGHKGAQQVHLVGFEKAGPWALLARALCGDRITRTAVDVDRFRFSDVRTTDDEMMLPGAVKYGGLGSFAALCAPGELYLYNLRGTEVEGRVAEAYRASATAGRLEQHDDRVSPETAVAWLLR